MDWVCGWCTLEIYYWLDFLKPPFPEMGHVRPRAEEGAPVSVVVRGDVPEKRRRSGKGVFF